MSDKYTAEMKNADAMTFLKTRFGIHYLKRLQSQYDQLIENSLNIELSQNYRLDCATAAGQVRREIAYFERHEDFANENGYLRRLLRNTKKKKETAVEM